jgi:MoaA/NifB/PqqE/SkfB family radical SAM enzyme
MKEWLCDFPWSYLFVNLEGEISFCCTNTFPRGSLTESEFSEIWNNKWFQLARAQFRDRRYLDAKCLPSCQWLIKEIPKYAKSFQGDWKPVLTDREEFLKYADVIKHGVGTIPPPRDSELNNIALNKDIHYESLISHSMPRRAHIEIIQNCNLHCRFCDIGVNAPKERFISDIVLDRLVPIYKYLHQIEILGGEIFAIGYSRSPLKRILEDLSRETRSNFQPCDTLLVTNGLAMGETWAQFLTTRENLKLTISISLDTCDPESYEEMRVGGKLDKVMENIRRLRRLSTENNSNTNIILTSVLCDITYKHIPGFLEFASEVEASYVMLQPLQKTGDPGFYQKNNIFFEDNIDKIRELKQILEFTDFNNINKENILQICNQYI